MDTGLEGMKGKVGMIPARLKKDAVKNGAFRGKTDVVGVVEKEVGKERNVKVCVWEDKKKVLEDKEEEAIEMVENKGPPPITLPVSSCHHSSCCPPAISLTVSSCHHSS